MTSSAREASARCLNAPTRPGAHTTAITAKTWLVAAATMNARVAVAPLVKLRRDVLTSHDSQTFRGNLAMN